MPGALSRKRMIFTIRLLVIIITAYMMLFTPSGSESMFSKALFIAFYLSTDLVVAALPERFFASLVIFYPLVIVDTIMVTLGIWLSGQAGGDLYLIYFLIISFSSLSSQFKYVMLNVFLFTCVYGRSEEHTSELHSH